MRASIAHGAPGSILCMLALVGVLLVVWLVLAVVGFVVKSLLWLAVVALVLFVATAVFGWVQRKAGSGR